MFPRSPPGDALPRARRFDPTQRSRLGALGLFSIHVRFSPDPWSHQLCFFDADDPFELSTPGAFQARAAGVSVDVGMLI